MIELYKSTGKEERVIQTYKKILKGSPHDIRAAMTLGHLYHKKGMRGASEKLFTDLGRRSVSDSEIIRKLAQLYLDQKKYDAAIIILNGMLKGAGDSSDIHYLQGVVFDRKGDKETALIHLKKVRSTSKFYQNAAVHMAFIYDDQRKISEAIRLLEDVNRRVTPEPELLFYLGTFYEEAEKLQKAVDVLEQGLVKDPKASSSPQQGSQK